MISKSLDLEDKCFYWPSEVEIWKRKLSIDFWKSRFKRGLFFYWFQLPFKSRDPEEEFFHHLFSEEDFECLRSNYTLLKVKFWKKNFFNDFRKSRSGRGNFLLISWSRDPKEYFEYLRSGLYTFESWFWIFEIRAIHFRKLSSGRGILIDLWKLRSSIECFSIDFRKRTFFHWLLKVEIRRWIFPLAFESRDPEEYFECLRSGYTLLEVEFRKNNFFSDFRKSRSGRGFFQPNQPLQNTPPNGEPCSFHQPTFHSNNNFIRWRMFISIFWHATWNIV